MKKLLVALTMFSMVAMADPALDSATANSPEGQPKVIMVKSAGGNQANSKTSHKASSKHHAKSSHKSKQKKSTKKSKKHSTKSKSGAKHTGKTKTASTSN